MIRRFLCWIGWHGPILFGNHWGRCGESFIRECPHCGLRWYGDEIVRNNMRTIGDWKTRSQCIKDGEWLGDKFEGQMK